MTFRKSPNLRSSDWQRRLEIGHIVAFRFPAAAGSPTARPALVLELAEIAGERFATLACGTSTMRRSAEPGVILVDDPEDVANAGLRAPVRFLVGQRLTVSLRNGGFVLHPQGSPVLGRLPRTLDGRLGEVRGTLRAEAGMALERRRTRRRVRVRGRAAEVEVVERRRRRRRQTPRMRALRMSS